MLKPSIDELVEKMGNRYALCIVAAKRARHLVENEDDLTAYDIDKPLSTAIDEIMDDEIEVHIPEPPKDRI